jgi:hypothetical protein
MFLSSLVPIPLYQQVDLVLQLVGNGHSLLELRRGPLQLLIGAAPVRRPSWHFAWSIRHKRSDVLGPVLLLNKDTRTLNARALDSLIS